MHGKLRVVRLISRTASSPGPLCKVADHFSRSSTGAITWFRSANSRREVCVKPRAIWPGRCSGTTQRGDWEGACAARAPKLHPPPGAHSHSPSPPPCSCGGKGREGKGRGGKKQEPSTRHKAKQSQSRPLPKASRIGGPRRRIPRHSPPPTALAPQLPSAHCAHHPQLKLCSTTRPPPSAFHSLAFSPSNGEFDCAVQKWRRQPRATLTRPRAHAARPCHPWTNRQTRNEGPCSPSSKRQPRVRRTFP